MNKIKILLVGVLMLFMNYILFGGAALTAINDAMAVATVSVSATIAQSITCTPNISTTSLGALTSGSVATANPSATTSVSTNDPIGMTLYINGANAGLKNVSSSYTVPSTSTTLVGGTEGYGVNGTTSSGIVLTAAYNKTGNAIGPLPTSSQTLASSSATTSANVMINTLAAISANTPSGAYSDTITYSCLGN